MYTYLFYHIFYLKIQVQIFRYEVNVIVGVMKKVT